MAEKLNVQETTSKMSLKEKAMFLTGSSPMHNYGIKRLNIKELSLNDGPNGLRRNTDEGDSLGGISQTYKSTVFPCSALLASTWNKDLLNRVGDAIAKECLYYDTNVLLGPAVNIKRNPLCGRNFEYYSEDPYLAGTMASSFINGVEKNHVACCVKHFACNNNEKFRFIGDSKVDEKALREIYLKPYEIILKNTNISSFMTAYNRLNDEYCSQNSNLLIDFLRKENGFNGVLMTDWGGIVDRVKSLENTLDLEMPGETPHNINYIIDSVKNKTLDEKVLNASVERMLNLYNKTVYEDKEKVEKIIFEENYKLALEAAEEGIVLLKNKNNVLPLKEDKKFLIVGDMFENIRFQGSGSSLLNPYIFVSPKDYFDKQKIKYDYFKAYDQIEENDETYLNELKVSLAKKHDYDAILVFGGQSDFIESEGFDRETIDLPNVQLKLIDELKKYNLPIVFVLASGSAVSLPFKEEVDGIIDVFLSGETVGEAIYNILFGKVNPSGKLTETFIEKYEDVPFFDEFSKNIIAYYKESILVGYRYYDTKNIKVSYPFGYGLSYTNFEYSNLKVTQNDKEIELNFDIKNTGNFDGKEIVQVYISKPESLLLRAKKELKAFAKVEIKKGETKNISLKINIEDLKVFDPISRKWILENGTYEILVGKNVSEIILKDKVVLKGIILENSEVLQGYLENYQDLNSLTDEKYCELFNLKYIPQPIFKRPFTMESPIYSFDKGFGKIFKKATIKVGLGIYKRAKKIKDPIKRSRVMKSGLFVSKLTPVNTLRSLSFSSSGALPYNIAQGILDMTNGHTFKGLKKIMKKEKIRKE